MISYLKIIFNAISLSSLPSTTNKNFKVVGEAQPNRKCSIYPANDQVLGRNHRSRLLHSF